MDAGVGEAAAADALIGSTAAETAGTAAAADVAGGAAAADVAGGAAAGATAADVAGGATAADVAGGAAAGATAADVAGGTGISLLPVTADATALSPEMATLLGVSGADAGLGLTAASGTGLGLSAAAPSGLGLTAGASMPALAPELGADLSTAGVLTDAAVGDATTGWGTEAAKAAGSKSIMDWLKAHPAQAGMLGLSMFQGTQKPKLPGAMESMQGTAQQMQADAQRTLASGGTASPMWNTQKAAIDQGINANLRNAIEQAKQSAATSGMGGTNSAVVQQKINQLTQQAETQRQQLYAQALDKITAQAVSQLTGGNQALTDIAKVEMGQSQEARQAAAQTAEIAMLLGSTGG